MPGTVDDFMNRFGSNQTIDDHEAAQYHDRFTSTHENDREFNNQAYHEGATEYLGKLPDDQFHSAAQKAVAQAAPQERQGLLGTLMGALGGQAGGVGAIAQRLGLGSTDPSTMNESDAARVLDYARREQPEALRKTVEEKPWFVKAMGSPVVMGALAIAAAKLVSNQRKNAQGR
ncbi:MAG: hypothetical protein JWL90_2701 [Chthoniobacteraceae bacterium]|nr:hypothetical protein [Chthoniobacteraceae bacterium]